MSAAIVGRVVVLAFAAVAATIAYVKYRNGQRQQYQHQSSRGGGPQRDDDATDRPPFKNRGGSSWENDQDDMDMVRNRTRSKTKSPSSEEKGCPICLEPYSSLTKREMSLMTTPCGHVFCKKCLDECLTRSRLCPFCRIDIERSRCHPIYL
ncbi:unnamed protein product [Orchesella dallaii]|uniref:RING-type domain-containing protein n=1 Tax=Orchesella dallaii TaxID=48710 RepID=A0ABP1RYS8_9HEXA